MRHDPKVGEIWRHTPSKAGRDRFGPGHIDFVVTSATWRVTARILASTLSGGNPVGHEQSVSICEAPMTASWERIAPNAALPAPVPITHEIIRSVRIWPPVLEPEITPEGYESWRCDVRLDWCKDEDDLERMEHGLGATPEEAYERAHLIAAAFMAEPVALAGDEWPANEIDRKELA